MLCGCITHAAFSHGCTPLHFAALSDRMDVARVLVQSKVSSNVRCATVSDFLELARFLLGGGRRR